MTAEDISRAREEYMMSNAKFFPNYQEIVRLPNVELVQRAKLALDEYIKAIRLGKNVTEKAKIYQAYEDERLKRLSQLKRQRGQPFSS